MWRTFGLKHLKHSKHICLQSFALILVEIYSSLINFVVMFKQMFEAFEAVMFAVICNDLHQIYSNLH